MNLENNKIILQKSDFISFEDDMIRHANLDMFQRTTIMPIYDNNLVVIQFQEHNHFISLGKLIHDQYFKKEQFKAFVMSIDQLNKLCDAYLLEFEKVDFSIQKTFYDPQNKIFLWRYMPTVLRHSLNDLPNLLRHIIIESDDLSKSYDLYKLKHDELTLDKVIEHINNDSNLINDGFFKTLFAKKRSKTSHVQKSARTNTVHCNHYPMLINKNDPSENFKLYFEQNTIGREDDNNIMIKHDSISRHHAIVYKEGHQHVLKDLHSTNGTYISSTKVCKDTSLINGDKIQFGDKEFIFIR